VHPLTGVCIQYPPVTVQCTAHSQVSLCNCTAVKSIPRCVCTVYHIYQWTAQLIQRYLWVAHPYKSVRIHFHQWLCPPPPHPSSTGVSVVLYLVHLIHMCLFSTFYYNDFTWYHQCLYIISTNGYNGYTAHSQESVHLYIHTLVHLSTGTSIHWYIHPLHGASIHLYIHPMVHPPFISAVCKLTLGSDSWFLSFLRQHYWKLTFFYPNSFSL
jgi:hypothetical protein